MNNGMFEGVVMADDDFGMHGNDDMFDVYDEIDTKPKKSGSKKKTIPVEIQYEGYTLEKAQPRAGDRPSWARVGQRQLPHEDKALINIAKQWRKKQGPRKTMEDDFRLLTSNQQGVVNRLLEDRDRKEKTKNAKWILYDVQRIGPLSTWRGIITEVKKIQVILKRVDKTLPLNKNGEYVLRKNGITNEYPDRDLIDLTEVTTIKQKKDKKVKKSRSLDDLFDNMNDDPLSYNMGNMGMGLGLPPPPPNHGRNNSNADNQAPRNIADPFAALGPPPPPMHQQNGMPGGFGLDHHHNGPGQFPPPPFPQQPFHQQPTSARQSASNIHPFQPDPAVASMAQFDLPPMNHGQQWPHPHQHGLERARTRSHSRDRRHSNRHPSISVDTGNMRRLENKIDDLTLQMANLNQPESDTSDFAEEELWSSPSDGWSFTPPSSPRSHFSDQKARGSLERRLSSAGRDPRYVAGYRSNRISDVGAIVPHSSYRNDRREYAPEYRRSSKPRPALFHSQTFDDYPIGSTAEQRYLPPAAPQPPRLSRRYTEHSGDRYEPRGYDDRRPSDYRGYGEPRGFADRYDGGRRDSGYGRRSNSNVYYD